MKRLSLLLLIFLWFVPTSAFGLDVHGQAWDLKDGTVTPGVSVNTVDMTEVEAIFGTGVFANISATGTIKAGSLYISGNVGIGTTSPLYDLDVQASTVKEGIRINGIDSTNNNPQGALMFSDASNAPRSRIVGYRGASFNAGELAFETANGGGFSEAMRIDENQNVGIGTTSPTSKLTVNGSISLPFANVSSAVVAVGANFHTIDCLTNDNDVLLNLPTAVGIDGSRDHPVRITNASGNKCYIEGAGSETLSPDGVNFFLNYSGLNTSGENVILRSDGANWQVWE